MCSINRSNQSWWQHRSSLNHEKGHMDGNTLEYIFDQNQRGRKAT